MIRKIGHHRLRVDYEARVTFLFVMTSCWVEFWFGVKMATKTERTERLAEAEKVAQREAQREEKKRLRRLLRNEIRRQKQFKEGILAGKPIEDWDPEELARGRPRDRNGQFRGKPPEWVTRSMHETAMKMFVDRTNEDLRTLVPLSMAAITYILTNEELNRRGQPMVPTSTKLECAKWVIEHVVGKARQPVDLDISVKLQGILAGCMVSPGDLGSGSELELTPAVGRDFVDAEIVESDDEADEE